MPKRPYGDAPGTTDGSKDTPPPKTDEPSTPGADEPKTETVDPKESAKEFIEAYDLLQSFGFSMYSNGMGMEKFGIPEPIKARATHHLARGLATMGSPEMHWGIGLAIALAPPSFFNWLTAKEHRKAAAAGEARKRDDNKQSYERGEALTPNIIYDARGNVIKRDPPPPPSPTPKKPVNVGKVHGECRQCGKDLHTKGRTYCSQSCSGAASKGRSRTQKTKPTTDGTVS